MKRKWVMAGLACAAVMMATSAQASLIGDDIEGELNFDGFTDNFFDPGSPTTVDGSGGSATVADPGIEFFREGTSTLIEVDFDGDSLWIGFGIDGSGSPAAFDMWFTDLDWVGQSGEIVGIDNIQTNFSNLSVNFTADSIHLRHDGGSSGTDFFYFDADIVTRHTSQNVPEPATMSLLGLGLLGVAYRAKRKRA